MDRMRRLLFVVLPALILSVCAIPCRAADGIFKEMLEDSIYGGLTGTLVGAAILAFTHKPGRNLQLIGYGAAAGVLGGASVGAVRGSHALARVEGGKVRLGFPVIMPDLQDSTVRGKNPLVVTAELVEGKF